MAQAITRYAVALGSNRRHGRYGAPADILRAAGEALARIGRVTSVSRTVATPAMGGVGRAFANAVLILETRLLPDALLDELKQIERRFGRRRGRRWAPRVLDLDIILWSEGPWGGPGPIVPHPEFRRRAFVLGPLSEVAPDWRDPISGATVRQLRRRLDRPVKIDRTRGRS